MKGTQFTFKDGPQVEVSLVGDKEIELYLESDRHRGVMQDDGTVQWDDGDIWRRDVTDAVSVRFGIRLHSSVRARHDQSAGIHAEDVGTVVGFTSECVEVKFGRRIVRCSACAVAICDEGDMQKDSAAHAQVAVLFDGLWANRGEMKGTQFTFKDGPQVEVSLVGDKEIELYLESDRHRGVMQDDGTVQWDDGDIWRRDVTDAVSVRFGIRLHSSVRARHDQSAGIHAEDVGTVVGFTSECVEVKFGRRIVRCSACAVAICDEGDVEQIPARRAGRRESAVRKCTAEKRLTGSDRPPTRGPDASLDATWYTGVVKWSRGSMAWLSSEELQARFPDQDIFLHKSEWLAEVMPRQKDRIVFHLMIADGKPKALDARTEAAHQAAKGTRMMSLDEYRKSGKSGR